MAKLVKTADLAWEPTNVEGIAGKSLIQFAEGTAKLIRLEPGARYPNHQHPKRTEYAYVLSGNAILTVGDEELEATVGDFLMFPTDTPHALANRSDGDAVLFVGAVYHSDTDH
ncbi:cupin domain-containing protein [Alicyclobacillus cycloheptanicus]|uniref:Quercetin dioxygenase-like cupin family protein n=1 Tax=Alicyclobacillus cycloheptanicus TaxID=1457 RepID=A0ABT9XLB7_9BACL|nr:cupin domain-containing protein [Alicyclobacillus cycloheptanicus]MDQ0191085.1 quercetin dioxygenase-like cupin family protein [Alicyclobacillus cycloheptanicus]WDM00879.1 cupin domain-containing protein [Alicyclobacillus cycloheptanicus]